MGMKCRETTLQSRHFSTTITVRTFADELRVHTLSMSFISWNCRGLGNQTTVQVLNDIVHTKRPVLLFLMETKLCSSKMEIIRTKVGFDNMFTVDCSGRSGGLALLWKKELNLTIVNHSRNFIDATINSVSSSSLWRYTGFYGCP
nr:uncharacterized protein LOC109184723 [Ipomoea batatas]